MKNEIALVCCYFNPCNYVSKYFNFLNFYQSIIKTSGVDVYVIESYNNNSKFRLNKNIERCESVFCDHTYWQKEQLLNILINKYKYEYNYIGWIDGDVEFVNSNWLNNIKNKLQNHNMVQIASDIEKETNFKQSTNKTQTIAHKLSKHEELNSEILHYRQGEPGYGFVYTSSLFYKSDYPMYQNAICGSGDFLNIIGYLDFPNFENYINNDRFFQKQPHFMNDFVEWRKHNTLLYKVGCANNTILVGYHGSLKNRKYVERETILRTHNFNPNTDIEVISETGMYNIKHEALRKSILSYFKSRNEDDFFSNALNTEYFKNRVTSLIRQYDSGFNSNIDPFSFLSKVKSGMQKSKPTPTNTVSYVCVNNAEVADTFYDICKNPIKINNSQNSTKLPYVVSYLKYIINNYDKLSEVVCFLNENVSISKVQLRHQISDFKKKLPNISVSAMFESEDITLAKNLHINSSEKIKRSRYTIKQWSSVYLGNFKYKIQKVNDQNKLINSTTNYYLKHSSPNYIVSAVSIWKTPLTKYEKLYNSLIKGNIQEEFLYINYLFRDLFV